MLHDAGIKTTGTWIFEVIKTIFPKRTLTREHMDMKTITIQAPMFAGRAFMKPEVMGLEKQKYNPIFHL